MIELRKVLNPFLKSIHPRVFYRRAPDDAQFPYLTYNFTQNLSDGECFEAVVVDIDGWDMPANGDTTALETLMQSVNDSLNQKTLTAEGLAVTFYLDNKFPVDDEEPAIERRKYIYQARLFGRS